MIEDDEGRLVLRGMLGSRGPYHYQTTPAQWQVREVTGGWQVMMIQDPVLGPGQELTNTGVWQCWGPELELTQHCHSFFLPQPGLLWLRSFFFNQSSFFGRHHDQVLARQEQWQEETRVRSVKWGTEDEESRGDTIRSTARWCWHRYYSW